MAKIPDTERPPTEAEKVASWRMQMLVRAGYSETSAIVLADRPDVDLHLAVRLLERGCPPSVALEILL